jgi:hypothetical protein
MFVILLACLALPQGIDGEVVAAASDSASIFVRLVTPDGTAIGNTRVVIDPSGLPVGAPGLREGVPLPLGFRPGPIDWARIDFAAAVEDDFRVLESLDGTTDPSGVLRVDAKQRLLFSSRAPIDLVVPRAGEPWLRCSLELPLPDESGSADRPAPFALSPERDVLAGRVVDDLGQPVTGSWCRVDDAVAEPPREAVFFTKFRDVFRVVAGSSPQWVCFSSPGHASVRVPLTPSPEPATIVLPRLARIHARVALPAGVAPEWFAFRVTIDDQPLSAEALVHGEQCSVDLEGESSFRADLVLRSTGTALATANGTFAPGRGADLFLDASAFGVAQVHFTCDDTLPLPIDVSTANGMRATASTEGIVRVPCPPEGIDLWVRGFAIDAQHLRVHAGANTVRVTRVR